METTFEATSQAWLHTKTGIGYLVELDNVNNGEAVESME